MNLFDKFEEESERTLDTLRKIRRTQPTPDFLVNVMRRVAQQPEVRFAFAPRVYRFAFVALFALVVLNVVSIMKVRSAFNQKDTVSATNPIQGIASEYRITVNGYQY